PHLLSPGSPGCSENKQLRSSSVEEISRDETSESEDTLDIRSARSRSFDAATPSPTEPRTTRQPRGSASFLEIPKWKMLIRRSSASTTANQMSEYRDCIHCILFDEYIKINSSPPPSKTASLSSESSTIDDSDTEWPFRLGSGSLEDDVLAEIASQGLPIVTLSFAPPVEKSPEEEDPGNGVTVISLEVPVIQNKGRSASVDSAYLQVPKRSDIGIGELPPKSQRSRSVDIALPIGPDGPYIVVPTEKPPPIVTQ
ncbi:hypothetical protein B4U79_05926, partial [Dinothrombium tinctorium]